MPNAYWSIRSTMECVTVSCHGYPIETIFSEEKESEPMLSAYSLVGVGVGEVFNYYQNLASRLAYVSSFFLNDIYLLYILAVY